MTTTDYRKAAQSLLDGDLVEHGDLDTLASAAVHALLAIHDILDDRLPAPEGMNAEEPPVGSQVTDREGDVWERREDGWALWWHERSGWLADLYGSGLDPWPTVRAQAPLHPTTDADRERVGLTAEPAPADVDPDEALAKVIHKVDDSDPHNWPYVKEARRGEYRSMARAAREHIEAEAATWEREGKWLDDIRERAEAEEWRWDHHDQTESDRADLLAYVDHLTAESARLRTDEVKARAWAEGFEACRKALDVTNPYEGES